MSANIFHNTPTSRVSDNRGLSVRDIAYHRHPDTLLATEARITRHSYDARGLLNRSVDPRLHETGLSNFTHATDLQGNDLRRQSVDAGTTLALNDTAGRPLFNVINIRTDAVMQDDRAAAVTRTFEYEPSAQAGRLIAIKEQISAEPARITERQLYGTHSEAHKQRNVAGQPICHYDTAGLQTTDSLALTGAALSMSRRLLKDGDNPETLADWQGKDSAVWDALLASDTYTTLTEADATGVILASTDAAGHCQRLRYNLAGQQSASWLTIKGGAEQAIVSYLDYSAAGQKLREAHGNGVATTYTYAPRTQRLVAIRSDRLAAPAKVLQDLRYAYDPVGNVLSISDDAQQARFWHNQKLLPERQYRYDSLYQLAWAKGREIVGRGKQDIILPPATVPIPTDSSAYSGYQRSYHYDSAGNLVRIRHIPAVGDGYTREMTVSDRSNRAVISELTEDPAQVDGLFLPGGQQRLLQPGQALSWTPRQTLLRVAPEHREGASDDAESYRYTGDHQRISKLSVQRTGGTQRIRRTLYLDALELHATTSGDKPVESLQVITVGEAGRAQVRVLHWTSGKPDGIANGQARYSFDDLLGSSALELDKHGQVISKEEYYPYGGTAVLSARSEVEASYKTLRYCGKERDASGLYYYGYRYYQAWAGRWLSADPAGTVDGLNLYAMTRNNPVTFADTDGRWTQLTKAYKKGDIVYGLDDPRKKAISALENAGFKRVDNKLSTKLIAKLGINKQEKRNILIQNDITNTVWDSRMATSYTSDAAIKESLKDAQRAIDFKKFIAQHKRYNVKNQPEAEQIQRIRAQTTLTQQDIKQLSDLEVRLWARTSKAGLEYQLLQRNQPVHFMVDTIADTIGAVASKTGHGRSITSSELRWLYRHRHVPQVQRNLIFYKNGDVVSQQSIFAMSEWRYYKPKRAYGSSQRAAR